MIVISDATPIISLIKADQLEILQKLFGTVVVPGAVFQELTVNPVFESEAKQIISCSYIQCLEVKDRKSVSILRKVAGLDAGESEAIVMADEKHADLLLMDERKGRRVAKQMGVSITGTVGILVHAFDEGLLEKTEVENCLLLMKKYGIRMSDALYETIITHIG